MEAVALILIAGARFCHSWYILGLYPDGRTVGIYIGALALASLITITFAPLILTNAGADGLAQTTLMKVLIIVWSGYGIGVAAQAIWDYDERAIGFYAAIPAVVSAVALIFFAGELYDDYGNAVTITMSAASLILALISGVTFFYHAIPFVVLRLVSGWFTLVGSVGLMILGLGIVTTVVQSN